VRAAVRDLGFIGIASIFGFSEVAFEKNEVGSRVVVLKARSSGSLVVTVAFGFEFLISMEN